MFQTARSRWTLLFVLLVLVILNGVVLFVLFSSRNETLRVSFLDVGQGDAILIQSPTGVEMLIDGGRDRSVLRELGKRMSPFDRSIDVVVATHPDADHIGGLSPVFERYDIDYFFEPGIPNNTSATESLTSAVKNEVAIQKSIAHRGMRIHLGDGAYADVLFPDRDESTQTETNDGSIALRIVYGETSFMLTGDLPSPFEDHLVLLDNARGELASDVLKAGHHGSKYSTDALWLSAVAPSFVVISAGEGNSYGHPAPEVISRIQKQGATILSTIEEGTITFESDGKTLEQK